MKTISDALRGEIVPPSVSGRLTNHGIIADDFDLNAIGRDLSIPNPAANEVWGTIVQRAAQHSVALLQIRV
jgi:hypothetical protein